MTKLEAINGILRRLGEVEVTSLDAPYPSISIALPALDEARQDLLADEWYFNTHEWHKLLPDSTGRVRVPDDVLVAYPDQPERFMYTGRYIVNTRTGSHVNEPVACRVVRDVPFEDLPAVAQRYVVAAAAILVYSQDFGVDESMETLTQEAAGAYQQLSAQHTRMRKHSTRVHRVWQRMQMGVLN